MKFSTCVNTGFHLRLGLLGPSGSGKTYSALKIATELGYERVGIIDTENRSARRYARAFGREFQALELERFAPADYCAALAAAAEAGLQVVVVDSLSHAWMGKGGVLEQVDQVTRRQGRGGGSSFNSWREVTPEHNKLVEALIRAPMHLIVTMRVKTEYVVEQDAKGKAVPKKVGLAPVQRDGLEYEFDIIGEMTPEHDLVVTKSRCPALADAVIARPGAEVAQTLRDWLDGAGPAPAQEPRVEREPEEPTPEAPPRPQGKPILERLRDDLTVCATRTQIKAVLDRFTAAVESANRPDSAKAKLITDGNRLAAAREDALVLGDVAAIGRQTSIPGGEREQERRQEQAQ